MNDQKIEQIISEQITSKVKIKTAISNDVYCINDNYIIRYKRKGDIFYHPIIEKNIDNLATKNNINATTLLLDRSGNRLSKRIFNVRYIDKNNDEDIVAVALQLKKLHSLKTTISYLFETTKRIAYYKKHSSNYFESDQQIIKNIKKYPLEIVLCHNDLVEGNLLFCGKKLYIIDYEYSALNDRYFDLASFISENDIDDNKKILLFLDNYFHNTPYSQEKFISYLNLVNLLWYYWASYQYTITKEPIFKAIKENKSHQLKKWENISHL